MAKEKRDLRDGVQNGVRVKAKAVRAESDDDGEDDDDSRPAKKKKKKKKSSTGLYVGIGVAAGAVLILILGVTVFMLTRPKPIQQAKVEEKKEEEPPPPVQPLRIIPRIEEGNPNITKKGGTGIVSNVRGAGYRTERQSELKQIALSFNQFSDEYPRSSRNLDNFLDYMKTYGPIRDAVRDGYYKINFNARLEASSVIAYERDIDNGQRHLCALGDGSVDYVPLEKLKMILGKDP